MDALDLDPGTYGGTYKLVGGRLALDLVNTISWPATEREHDWLDSPANLKRWLQAVGLPAPATSKLDLSQAHGVRALLDAVLRPLAHAQCASPKDLARLSAAAATAQALRAIDATTLKWQWLPPRSIEQALAPAIWDAAELVTAGQHERLRHCPACDWLFEDQTRNGQRRWCDMADCGSRDKARRYYHRAKS